MQIVQSDMASNSHLQNIVHDFSLLNVNTEYNVFHNSGQVTKMECTLKPYVCVFTVNNNELELELDTICAISLINVKTYNQLSSPPLQPAEIALSTFTGQKNFSFG